MKQFCALLSISLGPSEDRQSDKDGSGDWKPIGSLPRSIEDAHLDVEVTEDFRHVSTLRVFRRPSGPLHPRAAPWSLPGTSLRQGW